MTRDDKQFAGMKLSGIMITPELLQRLLQLLATVLDLPRLDDLHQRAVRMAGTKESAWVHRPEIPLVLQAYRDCDSWIEALRQNREPPNIGALGPFVRLGLTLEFARSLHGGQDRIDEIRKLAVAHDYEQLSNKAFELEAAYMFSSSSNSVAVTLGVIGGRPDFWLKTTDGIPVPVECKVVGGGALPSKDCRVAWKKFLVWAVEAMKLRGVSVALVVRANSNFDQLSHTIRVELASAVLDDLAKAPDGCWALRSTEDGAFLTYGYRISAWGGTKFPTSVQLGLDGETTMWTQFVAGSLENAKAYMFGLKFQVPESRIAAALDNLRTASDQLSKTNANGPGVAVLKVQVSRLGDLFELDREIRKLLQRRPHVSAVVLVREESARAHHEADGAQLFGNSLKPYVIPNAAAVVPTGWPDSFPTFFDDAPRSVIRSPDGELVPFDFSEEASGLSAGTHLDPNPESPWLLNATVGSLPKLPHVAPETGEANETAGSMTFYWQFSRPIGDSLLPIPDDSVILEWLVIGSTHLRVFRDRNSCLRVNRRTGAYQDNVTIDLWPLGDASELLLQVKWDAEGLLASLRHSDEHPLAICRSARSSVA